MYNKIKNKLIVSPKNNNDGDLLSALIFVESSDNDSAYRASEGAVGCLQIRKTMVNDINRILKRQGKSKRYTYIDRWSRDKSIQMFEIYCKYYRLFQKQTLFIYCDGICTLW